MKIKTQPKSYRKDYQRHILTWNTLMLLIVLGTLCSCRKFVEIDPPTNQITSKSAFSNEATANAAIVGIYSRMMQGSIVQNTTPYAGMSADELLSYSQDFKAEFSTNELSPASSPTLNTNFWNSAYQYIFPANLAIEQLKNNGALTTAVSTKLSGEAKFIRAYLYLNLISLFGDVPLVLSTDYQTTGTLPQTTKSAVIIQIISDLKDAVDALPDKVENEKIRPNKWAAMALLARVYLYNRQWDLAETLSNQVIESNQFMLVTDPNKVFLKNSSEAILQLFPTQANQNTPDGVTFLPASATETPKYLLTSSLLNAFEPGDLRRPAWVGSRSFGGQTLYYPAKYKIINSGTLSEYYMILRLAEQYLIRAEARIQQGKTEAGISDLNIIRRRSRALPATPINNPLPDLDLHLEKQQALLKVEQERRIELMAELGHRWFDLNRTGRSTEVLGSLKPSSWQATDMFWRIPEEQIKLNPFLKQNPGYN